MSANDCSLNDLDLKLEIPRGEFAVKFSYRSCLTIGVIILVDKEEEEEEEEEDDDDVEIVGSGKINASKCMDQLQAFLDGKQWFPQQNGEEENDEEFDMSEVLGGY